MDGFSSVTASRPLWSKTLHKKKTHRNVTLPVLARRTSDQHLGTNNSLHAFLTSQLEGNDRESYSRSQLRAMASSKLLSNNNNNVIPTNSRVHFNAERLAPLDPANFEKTRTHQRRTLPGPLQAAINEILAVRNTGEPSSEREETRPPIPHVKHTSPKKTQTHGRRPEWRRYIRRIMMTKGIQGSTLARYRRLVGIVARKNLIQSYASAAERVVRHRLEFRSAAMIQTMIVVFLNRRRQEKSLQRHKAAIKIQLEWRRVLEREKQRQLAKRGQLAKLDHLLRLRSTRSIQRSYRKYRHTCYLREEEQRQLYQANKMQKARLKLLQRYQMWREKVSRDKIDQSLTFTAVGEVPDEVRVDNTRKEYCNNPEESESCAVLPSNQVELTTPSTSITRNDPHTENWNREEIDRKVEDTIAGKELSELRVDVTEKVYYCIPEQSEECVPSSKDDVPAIASCTSITKNESPRENSSQDEIDRNLEVTAVEEESSELCVDVIENAYYSISEQSVPCESHHVKVITPCTSVTKDKSPHDLAEADRAIVDRPEPISSQLEQSAADVVDEESIHELAMVATATAMARTKAAERIVRLLLPKLQVRNVKKARAAIQIQCFVRLYLARQLVGQLRLETLRSLRQQLLDSWQASLQNDTKESLHVAASDQDAHDDQNEDDDDLDLELQENQSSVHCSDVYIHVLPTRNGQIPPGVPMLQSRAGAPLISLWKWSWSGQKWLSNGQ